MNTILTSNDSRITLRLQRISLWLGGLVVLMALLVLIGWQFDLDFFKRPLPKLVAMHPLTAVCLIFSGVSWLLYTTRGRHRLGLLTATLPLLVGLLMLIKQATGWGPALQTLLFAQKLKVDGIGNLSNLMAVNTAFCFLLMGIALVYVHTYRLPNLIWVQRLSLATGLIAFISLVSYAYQVQVFYSILARYPMAIHTAICFFLLALSVLLATADRGFMQHIFSRLSGGFVGRSLITVVLVVPFALGMLILAGYWQGLFTTELSIALYSTSIMIGALVIIWWNVILLNKKDSQQQETQAVLRQREEQIQAIFRAAPDAILVFDEQGRLVTWNARANQLLGLSDGNDADPRQIDSLIAERCRNDFRNEWQQLANPDKLSTIPVFDLIALKADQTEFEASFSMSQTTVQGKPLFIGFLQDVTHQRLATRQLQQANVDLLRSNDHLRQFAYVASHDLQEPLRKVQTFGNLLQKRYATELGDGADLLDRIQTASSRMSTLIQDLLAYSLVSISHEDTSHVSLTTVVNTVLTDLDLRIQETKATVTVDTLPVIDGDVSQLGQLFQNLLSNALKFSRTDALGTPVPPIIRVTADQVDAMSLPPSVMPSRVTRTYHRIGVSDNGIGFEEKYIERIFQVFQRLHNKAEFAGTGIGLAICEKVVSNHGGAITAASHPGEGSTFSVYLPN